MTIYTITYNEELMLPYFIQHYKQRFPDCKIVVYDNGSTDKTVDIALKNGCEVFTYYTDNKLNDLAYLEIKNNCWRDADGWVIVCDCDELLDISPIDLLLEEGKEVSCLLSRGWNMVNLNDNLEIKSINTAVRSESYDKIICFDSRKVRFINYYAGCHSCNPEGDIKFSSQQYDLRHYKYINIDYMINRHSMFAKRLSDINLQKGYGGHYLYSSEKIRNEFLAARKKAISI
jgi:glycosyltransferase involved in cell wall biosynthesis